MRGTIVSSAQSGVGRWSCDPSVDGLRLEIENVRFI